MKRLLLASSIIFTLAAGPAPAAPPSTWSGCYVDAGVGYGFWNQDHYSETIPGFVPLAPSATTGAQGWLGRFGGGCDYQFAIPKLGNFVVGVFGDYDVANLAGTFQDSFFGFVGTEKESGAWAGGARIGYLVTPSLLTYFDGGYTQARFDAINLSTDTVPSVAIGFSYSANTYSGWFVGSGAEYSLQQWIPGLFWRSEYRYATYGSANVPIVSNATGVPVGVGSSSEKQVQTITTALVYKFDWTGPLRTGTPSGSSLAADLPFKAPRLAPPLPQWTGCYIGAGGGYGVWAQNHYAETDPGFVPETPSTTTGGNGWLGRASVGCDYQFAVPKLGNFVVGVLADYDFTGFTGTFQETFSGFLGGERESGAWAVGARAGYLLIPSLLAYVDGGYTQAQFQQIGLNTDTIPPVPTIFFIPANTYQGWFVGGGTEYALTMDWIPIRGLFLRTEYRYASYAAADLPIQPLGITATAENMQKNVQTAMTSLIWRFNWPGGPR